jgi:hypothetical protein
MKTKATDSLLLFCVNAGKSPDRFQLVGREFVNVATVFRSSFGDIPELTLDEAQEISRSWPFSAQQIFDGFKRHPAHCPSPSFGMGPDGTLFFKPNG